MIPGRRTSKLKILFRLSIVPIGITLFWAYMFSLGGNYDIVRWTLIGGLVRPVLFSFSCGRSRTS